MPRGLGVALLRLAILGAGLSLAPTSAHAWTDAAVRGVHARVDLEPDGTAYVQLRLNVRVHGGWLEGLELNGLDEDLVLDESAPPSAVHDDGDEFTPTVRVLQGGRVQLGFRRHSPRRGVLMVSLAYYTSLAHRGTEPIEGEDRVRVTWTLPGWSSGLDGPEIEIHAPEGAVLVDGEGTDRERGLETSVEPEGDMTVVRWRRAHLPRTVPWPVTIEVPADSLDESLRGPPLVELPPPASIAQVHLDPRPYWIGFAIWLALIALLKLYAAWVLGRRARSRAVPLIGAPRLVRIAVILGACAGGAYASLHDTRIALGLFAIAALGASHRSAAAVTTSKLGAWRVVDDRWLLMLRRRAWLRWLEPIAWVDGTSWVGAVHMTAVLAVPWAWTDAALPFEELLLLSVLPLPIFLGATRLSFPPDAPSVLARLLRMCRHLETLPPGVALRPVMHVTTDGEMQDARVRTVLAHRPDGLLRLDLAMGQLPHAGGTDVVPMLLVLTRSARPVEEMLQERFSELVRVESPGGRRVLRAVMIRDGDLSLLGHLVDAFADCPPAPAQQRGAPMVQQTVAELPPPRAVGF